MYEMNETSITTVFTVFVLLILILLLPLLTFSSLQNEHDRNVIAAVEASNCISYDDSERTIAITCKVAHMTDIYNQLRDQHILDRQSNGIWLLNANLTIDKGATLVIDPTDTS
jgi:hypothetical protein